MPTLKINGDDKSFDAPDDVPLLPDAAPGRGSYYLASPPAAARAKGPALNVAQFAATPRSKPRSAGLRRRTEPVSMSCRTASHGGC